MTALLAIETSANLCSVAVAQHGEIIDIVVSELRGHTRHLLPAIDRLLVDAGLTLRRLDAIAVTTGPGSFTGLRIGIGVAQGLAYGADLPAVPLSSLATLAQGAIRSGQLARDEIAVTALDARMDEVYWGLYQVAGELVVALCPDRVSTPHALTLDPDLSAGTRYVGLGDGWKFAAQFPLKPIHYDPQAVPLARDMIPLALAALRAGATVAPAALEPRYLRDNHWQKPQRPQRAG
ncbi:MAG: tRNA (adenosine(37)-N6)-threonylcarbamoyltransferase complex dimerization subunit type 1 TsaB [Porticoccaceae bacterium]